MTDQEVVAAVRECSATGLPATTDAVARRIAYATRHAEERLQSLRRAGLVRKHDPRGGWLVADPVLAHDATSAVRAVWQEAGRIADAAARLADLAQSEPACAGDMARDLLRALLPAAELAAEVLGEDEED